MKLLLFFIGILTLNSTYTMDKLPNISLITHHENVDLSKVYEESGAVLGVPAVFLRKENDSLILSCDSRNYNGEGVAFNAPLISSIDSAFLYQPLQPQDIKTTFTQPFSSYPIKTIKVLVNNEPVSLPLKRDERISVIIKRYDSPIKIYPFLDTFEDEKSLISPTQRLLMHEFSTQNDTEGLKSCLTELEKHDFRDTFKLSSENHSKFFTFLLCLKDVSATIKQKIPKVIYDNSIIKPYFLMNRPEVVNYKNTIRALIEYNKERIKKESRIVLFEPDSQLF